MKEKLTALKTSAFYHALQMNKQQQQKRFVGVWGLPPYGNYIPDEHFLVNESRKSNDVALIPLEDRGLITIKIGFGPNPRPKGTKSRIMGAEYQVSLPDLRQVKQQALENKNNENLPDNELTISRYSQKIRATVNGVPVTIEMPPAYSPYDPVYARSVAAMAIEAFYKEQPAEPRVVRVQDPEVLMSNPLRTEGVAIIGDTSNLFDRSFSNAGGTITITKAVDDRPIVRGVFPTTMTTAPLKAASFGVSYDSSTIAGTGTVSVKTLPITLTAVGYYGLEETVIDPATMPLLKGETVETINIGAASNPGEVTLYRMFEKNREIPLAFPDIESFYAYFNEDAVWQYKAATVVPPARPSAAVQTASRGRAVPLPVPASIPSTPAAGQQVQLPSDITISRPRTDGFKYQTSATLDNVQRGTTSSTIVDGNAFTLYTITIESIDTAVAFGLSKKGAAASDLIQNQYLFFQTFSDGAHFSRVYMHPDFLIACISKAFLSKIKPLHAKNIHYDFIEVKTYAQKVWVNNRADVSGTTLLPGGQAKLFCELNATGTHDALNAMNKKEQLIFAPVLDGDNTDSTTLRYIPLSIIEGPADLVDKQALIKTAIKAYSEPLFLIGNDPGYETPTVVLNPCFKRGRYYRLAKDVVFKGLVSNSARGSMDED